MARLKRTENSLDVDRIVEAAWTLVDREGLAGLSTRSLAAELNVKGPALYWHVRSKQHLLSLMVERALLDTMGSQDPDQSWWEWMRSVGTRQRETLLNHRDSGLILSQAPPSSGLCDELFPRALAPLVAAGFSEGEAAAAFGALASMVLGWVIYEQSDETRALVLAYNKPDEAFAFALDAYIEGLRGLASRKR